MSYFSPLVNSPLVTYNPLSPNNSGERAHDRVTPHCVVVQRSVADKNGKAGGSFAIGFENNTLIVQRFPSSSYSSYSS